MNFQFNRKFCKKNQLKYIFNHIIFNKKIIKNFMLDINIQIDISSNNNSFSLHKKILLKK